MSDTKIRIILAHDQPQTHTYIRTYQALKRWYNTRVWMTNHRHIHTYQALKGWYNTRVWRLREFRKEESGDKSGAREGITPQRGDIGPKRDNCFNRIILLANDPSIGVGSPGMDLAMVLKIFEVGMLRSKNETSMDVLRFAIVYVCVLSEWMNTSPRTDLSFTTPSSVYFTRPMTHSCLFYIF